jgi:hypothetical protein
MNHEDVEKYEGPDVNQDTDAYKRGIEEEEELKDDHTLTLSPNDSEKAYSDPDSKTA